MAGLAAHPRLQRRQALQLLDALAVQIVPESGHAYAAGESRRLAMATLPIIRSGVLSDDDWQAWLQALPTRRGVDGLAWRDAGWIARHHDLLGYLTHLYVQVDGDDSKHAQAMLPRMRAAISALE